MGHLFTLAAAALLLASHANAQPARKPVPAKWLRDGRLAVDDLNFSIDAPSPASRWTYTEQASPNGSATVFIASNLDGSKYVVMVENGGDNLRRGDTENFVRGMKSTLPSDWQVTNATLEDSQIPQAGCERFQVELSLPSGARLYAYGYNLGGRRTYQMMTFSDAPREPIFFVQFVRSFRLLNTLANEVLPNPSGLFLIAAIAGAVFDRRYLKRGGVRSPVNCKAALLVLCAIALAVLVLLSLHGWTSYAVGELSATLGGVIFAFWEFVRWQIRRKNPLPQAGSIAKPQPDVVYTETEREAIRNQSCAPTTSPEASGPPH